jgi:hypothetical protein
MATRKRREYLRLLDAAKAAGDAGVDAFNGVGRPYKTETSLLLLCNAWELLAKAVLVHKKESIAKGQRGETISAEVAVHRITLRGVLTKEQAQTIQQVISLRHAACHYLLPDVPIEVMHHLLFYSCKFFREVVGKVFPGHLKSLSDHYLSLSFVDLTTYADKVQRAVSRVKRSDADKRLVWMLERGIQFDGSNYITEAQFAAKYKGRKRVLPHLALSGFLKSTDMVRIVPVEAPRNFTADITLRKGSKASSSLPVVVRKTDPEKDYPFLTKELAVEVGRSQNWVAKATEVLGLKGDPQYHQSIRASTKSVIQRYSTAARERIQAVLMKDPGFDPYSAASTKT